MRIVLAALGTRGDVQPYVALGKGLARRGHAVTLIADAAFAPLIRRHGLDHVPLHTDPHRRMEALFGRGGRALPRVVVALVREFRALARELFETMARAGRGADRILFSPLAFPAAHVAEAYALPFVGVYLQPLTPTRTFPNPLTAPPPPFLPFREAYHRWSYRAFHLFSVALLRPVVDRCRREVLGLPPKPWAFYANLDRAPIPILYGFSPRVVPRPPDWGPWIHITGYWVLEDEPWTPPDELRRFLEAGPPPVYVGFGSIVDRDPEGLTRIVVEALQRTGQRGILLGGWSRIGRGSLPSTVLRVEEVPHSWLFPRCAAVVHHGGAGTTAAALRAGVPQVVVPFFMDQPFWGRRVHALGVGAAPIPRRRLTARRLAAALETILSDGEIRRRARDLGAALQDEDGVETAVQLLEGEL